MDMYELQTSTDFFRVDDLLDFSNDDLFSSSSAATTTDSDFVHHHNLPPFDNNTAGKHHPYATTSTDRDATNFNNFPDGLCVPSDDIAELEWLSNFVDDSMSDIPMSDLSGITEIQPEPLVAGRARSKRSRAASTHNRWTSLPESDIPTTGNSKQSSNNSTKKSITIAGDKSPSEVRKCTHCASEKTPQWRTGPKGPKTLCNACGVRFKSGRLVPEYRPAASPTFVLTQHSNSHRKVMELRRKKEMLQQDNNNNHHQFYHHHHNHHDFKVC